MVQPLLNPQQSGEAAVIGFHCCFDFVLIATNRSVCELLALEPHASSCTAVSYTAIKKCALALCALCTHLHVQHVRIKDIRQCRHFQITHVLCTSHTMSHMPMRRAACECTHVQFEHAMQNSNK